MLKILVSNIGFGESNPAALNRLRNYGNVILNENGQRFTPELLADKIQDADILIAGTEPITHHVLSAASTLKLIARVGVGLDNIDLQEARNKGLAITYTPDAPTSALAEFTLTLMLSIIKHVPLIDRKMHAGQWQRIFGRQLSALKIGIIGVGRIGRKLITLIQSAFPSIEIWGYDPLNIEEPGIHWASFEDILSNCDIVTLHVPLTSATHYLMNRESIGKMKKGTYLINTSRGSVIDEEALFEALKSGHLAGAALDVFEKEPYCGPLATIENCILTSHIGSMTQEARALMEEQVVEEIVGFIQGKPLQFSVPVFDRR